MELNACHPTFRIVLSAFTSTMGLVAVTVILPRLLAILDSLNSGTVISDELKEKPGENAVLYPT